MRIPIALCLALVPGGVLSADTVHLKNGATLVGTVVEETAEGLVLEVGGAGRTRLAAADVEKWQRDAATASPVPAASRDEEAAPPPAGEKIRTTHVARLKHGGLVRGDLIEGDDPEALTLRVGALGTISVPRAQVAEVVEEAGEVFVPEARPRPAPPPPPPEPEATFEEIVAALATSVVDRHYAEGWGAPLAVGLEPDIAFAVDELTRQRATNRTRAENELREYGPAALPFLRTVANHPFDLTRRAVMRLVRDAGAWEGVPLAIAGLDDPDPFVQETAAEAIVAVLEIPEGLGEVTSEDVWLLWLDAEARRLEAELAEALEEFLAQQ